MINNELEYDRMANAEKDFWWYKNLHNLVLGEINMNFKSKLINILDAGCGTGGLMTFLRTKNFENIEGFDLSEYAVSLCKSLGLNVIKGNIINTGSIKPKNTYDLIISNDILCYIEDLNDRKGILDSFYDLLKDNGIVIINLPALSAFAGTHDIAVGIKHRFNLSDTDMIIDKNKFTVERVVFWPFLLSAPIFFTRLFQRIKLKIFKPEKIISDIEKLPNFLNQALYCITEFENKLIKYKPFGSSIFLVLKKIPQD